MKTVKRIAVILLSFVLLLGTVCGCSDKGEAKVRMSADVSESDADWNEISEGEITLENQNVKFVMDSETTHFSLTDLKSGKSYTSVPMGEVFSYSDEDAERLRSEVTVTYYQQQSEAQLMFSAKDCTDSKNHKILTNGEALRVYYNLGATADEFFAPAVFTKGDFERLVLEKIGNPNAQRRISRYYTLYEKGTDGYAEMAEKYPALKKTAFYILKDSPDDNTLEEITMFMEQVGYTKKLYDEVVEKYGIATAVSDKAGFCIPVEYRLCSDGFTAELLSDLVKETNPDFKLQKVDFLEFFASRDQKSQGFYMIPDGSGSLIKINGTYKSDYNQSFYGSDFSVLEDSKGQLLQNLMFPVFSICEEDGGLLAIVEKAAEMAELNIKTMSNSAPQNHIFTSFIFRAVDVTDIGEKTGVPVYNLFSKHLLKISPKIRFVLFKEDKADYSDMAAYYRNYLLENEQINKNEISGEAPLYLDYLCMILKPSSVMGVSYNKKIVLSTISEIIDSVEAFREKGIKNIVVRLKGYGTGGLTNKAYNRFEIDSKVGSAKEIEQLKKLLEKDGGALYLDADFQFVYSMGNGFSQKNSSAHYLNRAVVYNGSHDIVTRKYDAEQLPRYFVSPTLYGKYSSDFISSLKKKLPDTPSLSFGLSGLYLGSDYASDKDMDRAESLYLLKTALKNTKIKAMFDNGNAYVLPFAQAVVNAPLTSSANDMEYMHIPFYQMIVHGLVSYGGIPINLSQDFGKYYLQSVEYGASLCATLITRENSLLTNTDYESVYYSVNADGQLDTLSEMYNGSKELLERVQNARIEKYEKLADNVYAVTYDNKIKVIVNYGEEETAVSGNAIEAESFKVIEQKE